jgi:hypothetical protein
MTKENYRFSANSHYLGRKKTVVFAHEKEEFAISKRRYRKLKVINNLYLSDYQYFAKKLHFVLKKNAKKRTTYQKNAYLCSVLINK